LWLGSAASVGAIRNRADYIFIAGPCPRLAKPVTRERGIVVAIRHGAPTFIGGFEPVLGSSDWR
jgi:hypothetical protein